MESETGHVIHHPHHFEELLLVLRVIRHRFIDFWLRTGFPRLGLFKAFLETTDRCLILINPLSVRSADPFAQIRTLPHYDIENTPLALQPPQLLFNGLLITLEKHFLIELRRALDGGDLNPRLSVGQAPRIVDPKRQRSEAGLISDLIGHDLVEGNRVAKARPSRMRGSSQESFVSPVSPVDAGMRESTEDGELIPVLRDPFEVRRQLVITPLCLGKEELGNKTEILVDCDHSLGRRSCRRASERFEHGQAHADTSSTQKSSTGGFHFFRNNGL